jgi:flavin reductase (DIM6/NTAB) family NADH-FMN oxidoreductase RutF
MCLHEAKYCPRCTKTFECKVGNITQCQCYGVALSAVERAYIDSRFTDCVCRNCLLQLKNDYLQSKNLFISQLKKHR